MSNEQRKSEVSKLGVRFHDQLAYNDIIHCSLFIANCSLLIEFSLLTGIKNITILNYMNEYAIILAWDDEASVWTAINDDIPIALESESLDILIERVKGAAPELLELNKKKHNDIANCSFVYE